VGYRAIRPRSCAQASVSTISDVGTQRVQLAGGEIKRIIDGGRGEAFFRGGTYRPFRSSPASWGAVIPTTDEVLRKIRYQQNKIGRVVGA